jgi:hypothetical protein
MSLQLEPPDEEKKQKKKRGRKKEKRKNGITPPSDFTGGEEPLTSGVYAGTGNETTLAAPSSAPNPSLATSS